MILLLKDLNKLNDDDEVIFVKHVLKNLKEFL